MVTLHEHKITKWCTAQDSRAMDASHSAELSVTPVTSGEPIFHSSRIRERFVSVANYQSFQHSCAYVAESFGLRPRLSAPKRAGTTQGSGGVSFTSRRRSRFLNSLGHVSSSFATDNGDEGLKCPTQKWGERCSP